jgi:Glycosyltransferase family 17
VKMIDSFIFYNELDMLEARLEYLYDHVDQFVIVEGNYTFAGKPKPFFFQENKERFAKYADKITARVYTFPEECDFGSSWNLWKLQTDYISECLEEYDDSDIVHVSDLDEIPNLNKLQEVKELLQNSQLVVSPMMTCFYYNLNTKISNYGQPYWISSYFAQKAFIREKGAYNLRFRADHYKNVLSDVSDLDQLSKLAEESIFDPVYDETFLDDGGWHLTYFMTEEQIKIKLESFAHSEFNTDYHKNIERLKECVTEKKDLFDRKGHEMETINPQQYFSEEFLRCFGKWSVQ